MAVFCDMFSQGAPGLSDPVALAVAVAGVLTLTTGVLSCYCYCSCYWRCSCYSNPPCQCTFEGLQMALKVTLSESRRQFSYRVLTHETHQQCHRLPLHAEPHTLLFARAGTRLPTAPPLEGRTAQDLRLCSPSTVKRGCQGCGPGGVRSGVECGLEADRKQQEDMHSPACRGRYHRRSAAARLRLTPARQ